MDSKQINHTRNTQTEIVHIVHVSGQTDGTVEYFYQKTITFGRNPACDVVFPSNFLIVSRLHAMINLYGNQYILKNLSPNGCYVNGIKKEECLIKEGDLIAFADGGPMIVFTLNTVCKKSESTIASQNLVSPEKHSRSYNMLNINLVQFLTLLTQASIDFTF